MALSTHIVWGLCAGHLRCTHGCVRHRLAAMLLHCDCHARRFTNACVHALASAYLHAHFARLSRLVPQVWHICADNPSGLAAAGASPLGQKADGPLPADVCSRLCACCNKWQTRCMAHALGWRTCVQTLALSCDHDLCSCACTSACFYNTHAPPSHACGGRQRALATVRSACNLGTSLSACSHGHLLQSSGGSSSPGSWAAASIYTAGPLQGYLAQQAAAAKGIMATRSRMCACMLGQRSSMGRCSNISGVHTCARRLDGRSAARHVWLHGLVQCSSAGHSDQARMMTMAVMVEEAVSAPQAVQPLGAHGWAELRAQVCVIWCKGDLADATVL